MADIPVVTVKIPQYRIDTEPDDKAIGKVLDEEIKKYFLGDAVVVRGIASSEHPNKTIDELIDIIKNTGTDRYDLERAGDRYGNIDGKHIDFFGFPAVIKPATELLHQMIWGFYHSAKAVHGYPVKIDVVIIYDASSLNQIEHQYVGRDDIKNDGFTFKNPNNKDDAIKAIF